MITYLIRRILQMLVVLLLSSMAIFAILNFSPGGPVAELRMQSGDKKTQLSDAEIKRLEAFYGLNKPVHIRYVAWLLGDDWLGQFNPTWAGTNRGILRGDLGKSWKQNRPVIVVMSEPIPNTLRLVLMATLLSILVAVPAGIYSAVKQYSKLDYSFTFLTFVGTAIPSFWFGLMLIIVASNEFKKWGIPFFPPGGTHSLRAPRPGSIHALMNVAPGTVPDFLLYLVLPTLMLSLLFMAGWGRYTRSSMLEVLRQDYVRTARAKGLADRMVITKHALRNALIPLVTIITFELPAIFSGVVITESVFAYPGTGRLLVDSLAANDYPIVQGFLVFIALLTIVSTLLADVLYTIVDPRIRFS